MLLMIFPSRRVTEYEDDIAAGSREPAIVAKATFVLEAGDVRVLEELYGSDCLQGDEASITIEKGYSNEVILAELCINEQIALEHLMDRAELCDQAMEKVRNGKSAKEIIEILASPEIEQTLSVQTVTQELQQISDKGISLYIYESLLCNRLPKFLYFDEYYQMKGEVNVEELLKRRERGSLEESDYPLLGLLEIANLDLNDLINPGRTERLFSKLEAAANGLSQRVLRYWSQNQHIRMKFERQVAAVGDPGGMTTGTNIWGRVEDTKHGVTTSLGTRSRGFVWFFSFLAWYSRLRRQEENLILLLDEPGLSLHAKAQEDLLRYFDEELKPHNQVIYTTHSPFMVDPKHFGRVRIVQDRSIESDSDDLPAEQQGTKVITDVLEATSDSLFPLQGALGYEIHQSLFVGPNCLIVEGVSDLLYIQTMSTLLQESGASGLSADWTITPVGGSDKVPTFVALIGAQTNLNVAVLIDYQKKDQQSIENLYKKKLLNSKNVFTYADFLFGNEADIEDMFEAEFYLLLVNSAFNSTITVTELPGKHPRILRRIEELPGG